VPVVVDDSKSVKHIKSKEPEVVEVVPVRVVEEPLKTRQRIEARKITAGLYSVVDLAIAARLVPANKNAAQVYAISKSPIRVIDGVKYIKDNKTLYKIKAGVVCYLRFGGKKYKLKGM
jgi:hypothetical protein